MVTTAIISAHSNQASGLTKVQETFLQIVVAVPLCQIFDYCLPSDMHNIAIKPGTRVRVPFGNTKKTGIVVGIANTTKTPRHKLKNIEQILDEHPVVDEYLLKLTLWAASYYSHPAGEVVFSALPSLLRKGQSPEQPVVKIWNAIPHPDAEALLKKAPKQLQIWQLLNQHPSGMTAAQLNELTSNWQTPVQQLVAKQLVTESVADNETSQTESEQALLEPPLQLNAEQQTAFDIVTRKIGCFGSFLLFGDTGSGKTEIYLQFIEHIVNTGKQVLVLVPEIGLTPQLVRRFEKRFAHSLSVYHSGLTDRQRYDTWDKARSGESRVILGTRSAVFLPLASAGAIIIDEEHDLSFKQQEGFRYSARDVAVVRARQLDIPIILGSATPSLESLQNCTLGKYQLIRITERAGNAKKPDIQLIDVRQQKLFHGLSTQMLNLVEQELANNKQTLLFLNRRGYSPTLMCHDCGWIATCDRCDARLTWHAGHNRMRCHHCGSERPRPVHCGDCQSESLHCYGHGTEQLESAIRQRFPSAGVLRIDRDSTRRKDALQQKLQQIEQNQILIGTQMLAKGHHFPNVTLVGIIDADQGLFGADFRASERMAQLILQVAGRAGRAEHPGRVFIQTHCPDHPLMQMLTRQDYQNIANSLLAERAETEFPPFSYLALLRAESTSENAATEFLQHTIELANRFNMNNIELYGPMPAPMEKRAGKYRAQLLVHAKNRQQLRDLLSEWTPEIDASKAARTVRWSVDVDPQEIL